MNYYNDTDQFCCEWLRNLIDAGLIPAGHVDDRSVADVRPDELRDYTQCHFFAGIGGWPLALRLAGWPDDAPVWTGSCPCQPFSDAGKRRGTADERHLWPEFRRLIAECKPPVCFGEQVASKAGRLWLAGVRADLEALGYAVGGADLCAAGVGAPHIRQRLFWVADANSTRRAAAMRREGMQARNESEPRCSGVVDGLGNASTPGQSISEHHELPGPDRNNEGRAAQQPGGAWADFAVVHCRDGKARRISAQSGDEPLAYGIPRDVGRRFPELRSMVRDARRNRVGRLRGFGNAIVPQVAAEFVMAYLAAAQAAGGNNE